MRAPGGGASCLGVGRPGSGVLPPPTARPLGGLLGPTTHWLSVRGVAGVGTRHQPHSARSCVLWGRHEGARGGRLLPGCGASWVGGSPPLDCPPSGRAAGAHYPLAVGAGGCGRGDPSPTPQRALWRAGFARCGGGRRVPGGGASCLGVGRPGSGAVPAPTARPLGGLPGPTTHWLWVPGGAGVPRVCACACPAWPGRAGRPPGRVLVHLNFPLAVLGSPFACSAPSGLGLTCLRLLLGFFVSFPLLPPVALPVVSCFACFPAPGSLGLGVLSPPPFFFSFPPPPLSAPLSPALRVFRPGLPLALASCCPPPSHFCVRCRVVLCRRALSSFFVFLPAGGAGFLLFPVGSGLQAGFGSFLFPCSACAVPCWRACVVAVCSVLPCPRGAGWCFVLLPDVFVCLLLGLAVLCCLLVGPGGSWCRVSVACFGVSLGAVLRRVAARCVVVRCVVSYCSVWCCRALCCALGRCLLSSGPVPSGAVFCLVPPPCVCFAVVCRRVVLFAVVLCAVCALGCRVVRFLSSPPCAVLLRGLLPLGALLPCAVPRGAVLPRGAVVSCPAALLGLFLASVWLYLLVKPLQNFVK